MRLSAQFLDNVESVNVYEISPVLTLLGGSSQTLYFQLIDQSIHITEEVDDLFGRYIPGVVGSDATLEITWSGQGAADVIGVTVANITAVTETVTTTLAAAVADLADSLNLDPDIGPLIVATADSATLTLTGNQLGNAGNYIPILPTATDGTVTPSTLSYMEGGAGNPGAVTLRVTLMNINDARTFSRFAYNPFPGDLSIWGVDLMESDPLVGTVAVTFALVDQGKSYTFKLQDSLRVTTVTSPI